MKKLIPIIIILLSIISLFSGCTQQNGLNINFQTFNSGNISFSEETLELLPQEEIDAIKQFGKDLDFEVEYPQDWKAEYEKDCCGFFSIRFYPINTDWRNLTYIRLDLMMTYPNNISVEHLKIKYVNPLTDFTEEDIQLSNDIFVWKIIGKSLEVGPDRENYTQGIAYILSHKVEVYMITTYFSDSNSTNLQIFDHMARSFNKFSIFKP